MRLIYPLLWAQPGRGADREQSINTAAALARAGVEVTLLLPRGPADPPITGDDLARYFEVEGTLRVVQRPAIAVGPPIVPSARWLWQVFADDEVRRAGVLYSRIPVMLGLGSRSPVPFVFDHYRPWPDDWPWLRPLIRRTARQPRCLGFILHSRLAADSYLRAGVPAAQVLVGHNGANLQHMAPRLDRDDARRQLGLPIDRQIAVYAGRLRTDKGVDQILALAAARPQVLVLLIGSEGHGAVEQQAAALPNVRVLPWQTPAALPPYLYAADVLLIPASSVTARRNSTCVLPLKVYAYLAAGRPILAPAAADTAELLVHDDTACLVPPDDVAAAAAALDRLATDPAYASALAERARLRSASLTWDRRAARIIDFLRARLAD